MKKLKHWIRRNLWLSIGLAAAGLVLAPLLWPFILAAAFQSLSLALPVLAIYFVVRRPKRLKTADGQSGTHRGQWDEAKPGMYAAGRLYPVRRRQAAVWYQREGREKLLRLKEKAGREGSHSFLVGREGFCSIRRNKKTHRIGVVRNLPREDIPGLAETIRADGMKLRVSGKYIRFSWGEEAYN